jgi:hypothetical protein
MLVIADQRALGVGRQRRLAGTRQAEEDRAIGILADVGRAVHRHDALLGKHIIEHGEHRFLHLAGVLSAADEHEAVGQVERNHGLAAGAMACRVGLEARKVDDGELRREAVKGLGHDQQVLNEQGMPGMFCDHPGRKLEGGISASHQVLDINALEAGVSEKVPPQGFEGLAAHGLVVVPPDGVFRGLIADHELVIGAAARVVAGRNHEPAALGHDAFTAGHRILIEHRSRRIPRDAVNPDQAEIGQLGTDLVVCGGVHGRQLLIVEAGT